MGRSGKVFSDRYHAHILKTPAEVRNALRYVRDNHRKHEAQRGRKVEWADEYASASPLLNPRTWLLQRAGAGP